MYDADQGCRPLLPAVKASLECARPRECQVCFELTHDTARANVLNGVVEGHWTRDGWQ